MTAKQPWYLTAVFYELYVRAFRDTTGSGNGDLRGVIEKLDYIQSLGVDCIWLLPIYPSPLKDDGYDVAEYYDIHEHFGTLADFELLIEEAHKRELKVIADLVVNHTSDQHPWFKDARSSRDSEKRDWYVWSDTTELYKQARIIFLDTEDSNWAYDEESGEYYWHRFYTEQPDLNFDNPEVQEEMLKIMDFWLEKGIDGFRVDAVPYLFERENTNCENLQDTHDYLKYMRRHADEHFPDALLLCEANQWPQDVVKYLGDGDEFQMAFHFPVMPRIYMALKQERSEAIVQIMEQTPQIPENTQWCMFLRNHDELTLEMVTPEEREWMWDQYAPEDRMRLNLGIRRRMAPLLDNDQRKILLINNIMFSLPGAPIVYYGDEIGMGDDIWLDDRNGVRTPMQWDDSRNGGFSEADELYAPVISDEVYGYQHVNVASQINDPDSLLSKMCELIALRKANPTLSGPVLKFARTNDPALLAVCRPDTDETILIIHNLSAQPVNAALDLREYYGYGVTGLNNGTHYPRISRDAYRLTLTPYQSLWLKLVQVT